MSTLNLFAEEIDTTAEIDHLITTISAAINLAPNRLFLAPHSGKEEATDIILEEMPYPPPANEDLKPKRTITICYFKDNNDGTVLLAIKPAHLALLAMPESAVLGKRTQSWQLISFAKDDTTLLTYIKSLIKLIIDSYESASAFGCCSRFKECAAGGYCMHENILYAKGCFYGKKFKSGWE